MEEEIVYWRWWKRFIEINFQNVSRWRLGERKEVAIPEEARTLTEALNVEEGNSPLFQDLVIRRGCHGPRCSDRKLVIPIKRLNRREQSEPSSQHQSAASWSSLYRDI